MTSGRIRGRVLISGGGIAGLTLGNLLHEKGWECVVIEKDSSMREEGYMMDFYGTGWDVARRMNLTDRLLAIHYPIDSMQYVDANGKPYLSVPIKRIKKALNNQYVYLRRADLEGILYDSFVSKGVAVCFGTEIKSLSENGQEVQVEFRDGTNDAFDLVFGADGVHSMVRQLVFGTDDKFERCLDSYIAAFHVAYDPNIGNAIKVHEERDRLAAFYPLNENWMDGLYGFHHKNIGYVPKNVRLQMVKDQFRGAEWILERILNEISPSSNFLFDSLIQIIMPEWSRGRVVLLGDACGCLTLMAAQGSHMAMAGAYILTTELERYPGDHRSAFEAYEKFLKPFVRQKQDYAMEFSKIFLPSQTSRMWLRRLVMKLLFNRFYLKYELASFGSQSLLKGYRD
jgi:2-polyprenyl-6-methoxyphenol hydroxylase-like FAD-dependent oxidoreductase